MHLLFFAKVERDWGSREEDDSRVVCIVGFRVGKGDRRH